MVFVVDKVALKQGFLPLPPFSPANIIPPWLSISIDHLEDEQRACWFPQFRDIVSPRRHQQQQDFPFISDEKFIVM
jgi:hypothetical protein